MVPSMTCKVTCGGSAILQHSAIIIFIIVALCPLDTVVDVIHGRYCLRKGIVSHHFTKISTPIRERRKRWHLKEKCQYLKMYLRETGSHSDWWGLRMHLWIYKLECGSGDVEQVRTLQLWLSHQSAWPLCFPRASLAIDCPGGGTVLFSVSRRKENGSGAVVLAAALTVAAAAASITM